MADSDASQQPKLELDAEAKQLQLDQFKAEARKAIAEANAGSAKAGLYDAKSEPVKGETTLGEKSGSLVGVVALRALGGLAADIAKKVNQEIEDGHSVLIVEHRSLAATDAPYAEISARFEWFSERFAAAKAALEEPPSPAAVPQPPPAPGGEAAPLAIAPAVLGAIQLGSAAMSLLGVAADVVGMFKTNYAIEGRDVTLDYAALAALVAEHLPNSTVPVVIDGLHTLEGSPTMKTFESLLRRRSELEELALRTEAVELSATTTEIDELTAQIAAVRSAFHKASEAGDTDKAERNAKLIAELNADRASKLTAAYLSRKAQVAMAKATVAAFDQYSVAITTAPAGQSYPPLIAAAIRDLLHENREVSGLPTPIDYVLYLSISSSGGDVATKQGLFTHNERLGLVAGVQATYVLVDRAGVVKTSGSLGGYSAATFHLDDHKLTWARVEG